MKKQDIDRMAVFRSILLRRMFEKKQQKQGTPALNLETISSAVASGVKQGLENFTTADGALKTSQQNGVIPTPGGF